MAITSQTQKASFPLTLELNIEKLKKPAWLKISQIRTLSVDRIGKKIARADSEILNQAIEGLNEILGY